MISSGNQNQFSSSFASLRDLFKALMFLLNLNGFNSSPLLPDQRFAQWKGSSKVWKEKGSKWFSHFFSLSLFLFMHYLCVLLSCFWVSLVLCYVLFNMFLFVCFQFCFILFFIKKKTEKLEKYKNNVCFVYVSTCVPWMVFKTKISKLCIFCNLDEHLNAQLSKWALWLVFVIITIKKSLVFNTHLTLFDRKD